MLNFIAIDLQLYKIFNIMRVSCFGTQCTSAITEEVLLLVDFVMFVSIASLAL